ncbi:MAG: NADH-quinone oxidoreductase subunit L, partial [Thermodesulfobacteriota bacterium]
IIHGGNVIGDFLSPVMRGQELLAVPGQGAAVHHSAGQELLLMAISLVIALVGWWLARKFYVTSPWLPSKTAAALGGLYRLVYHKYWVDELYDAIAVRPIVRFSNWLWNVADDGIIDWLANGFARVTAEAGATLRQVQTGLVQNYALSILVGVIFVLGYMALR